MHLIRQTLSALLVLVGKACIRMGRLLYISPAERRVSPWVDVRGDRTFRLAYDLEGRSIVFDLGGYEGQWASDIFAMYCCTIHVFEPVPSFARALRGRFARNSRIYIHDFGLASKDETVKLHVDGPGSTIYRANGAQVAEGKLIDVADFLSANSIDKIDLLKINIEGGEYDLLERLIAIKKISSIRNIQVQFHDFVPNAENRMRAIQRALAATHNVTYQYEFVWENWEAKRWPPDPILPMDVAQPRA